MTSSSMHRQLVIIALTLTLFHVGLISASPSVHFVQKSLTLDLATTDGDTVREWIVSTQADRILLLKIQSEQPIDKAAIESILTISDSRDEASILFPVPDSNSILPIYSKGNSVLIRLNNKSILNGMTKLQLKIEKAVDCPESLGGSSACSRVVDDESCYCATFSDRSWSDTKLYCLNNAMKFVAIESQEEDSAIWAKWGAEQTFWIGATDLYSEGTFFWDATFKPLSPGYTNWEPGRPNINDAENCVHYLPNGQWEDWDCSGGDPVGFSNKNIGGICESQP